MRAEKAVVTTNVQMSFLCCTNVVRVLKDGKQNHLSLNARNDYGILEVPGILCKENQKIKGSMHQSKRVSWQLMTEMIRTQ